MDRPADAAPTTSQADAAPSLARRDAALLAVPADSENERPSRKEHGSRRSKSNRAPGEKARRTSERRRRDSQGSNGIPAPQPLGSEVTADELPKDAIEVTLSTEPTGTLKGNGVTIDDDAMENGHRGRDARSKVLRERHSTLTLPTAPAPADSLVPAARLLPATVPDSATAVPLDEQSLDEKSVEGPEIAPPIPIGEHTWEELEAIEKRRRAILLRGEHDVWKTLCCVDGTVMKFLLEDSLFWITVILYITTRLLARYSEIPAFVAGLGDGNLTTIGGFITFFLALYVNNSHARYFDQYDAAMACKGRILDVASLATTYLPKTTAQRLLRYMNAAHVAGYVGLSSTYSYANFFVKLNKDFGLLTARELERMNTIDLDKGGSCNRELIVWCLREIQACHAQGIIDHELSREFRDHILRLRAALGTIYDAADLPIPFFYVHFISLLTALYLPLFAVSAAYKVGIGTEVFGSETFWCSW
ncbi:hypothetical protein MHU86_4930 [Fragilaria crotonensis]|nr:hypothetical protein MHU86_4930 [Fragilaria crotonensis]